MTELSAFEVLALAKEIDLALRGSYVNNIYSLGEGQAFRLRASGGDDKWLVVSPTYGCWVSQKVSDREETSEFTSSLRKELARAKFAGASQLGFDRVFRIAFAEPARMVVVEMMPPGNIVVTDEDESILCAEREVRTPKRRVARGSRYTPPGQSRTSPADLTPGDVSRFLTQEKTAGRAIGRHVALPR
ncbi:MAG TPA: NFACT family protein, partial [Nitrososphaerales archaeon]|nr:NFACT family protein [Nitrososphaerales archaeon]